MEDYKATRKLVIQQFRDEVRGIFEDLYCESDVYGEVLFTRKSMEEAFKRYVFKCCGELVSTIELLYPDIDLVFECLAIYDEMIEYKIRG